MVLPDLWGNGENMNGKMSSALLCSALLMGGCSTGLLGGGGKVSGPGDTQNIQVGNELAMPPDLALRAPGQVSETYQPNKAQNGVYDDASLDPAAPPPVRRAPQGDIYDQYNVSKTKPDGTKKDGNELAADLRAAILAKKRKQNPSYGTIGNIGAIFSDQ